MYLLTVHSKEVHKMKMPSRKARERGENAYHICFSIVVAWIGYGVYGWKAPLTVVGCYIFGAIVTSKKDESPCADTSP
jgi:hypothetical protein